MKFIDLLPAFKNGQRLRRNSWNKDEYCGVDEDGMYWTTGHVGKSSVSMDFFISIEDLEANDWDFYFVPKRIFDELSSVP